VGIAEGLLGVAAAGADAAVARIGEPMLGGLVERLGAGCVAASSR
jgi:hypothetical protein